MKRRDPCLLFNDKRWAKGEFEDGKPKANFWGICRQVEGLQMSVSQQPFSAYL